MAKFIMKPMVVEAVTFDELLAYGKEYSDCVYDGVPWSFKYMGIPIIHETDDCYLIGGTDRFTKNKLLIIKGSDVSVVDADAFNLMSEPLTINTWRENNTMAKFKVVKRIEEAIKLPVRSTKYSAGYDFYAVEDTHVSSKGVTYVKTGVKVKLDNDEFLMLCNRSSNPGKKELVLINGVGIIDADYYGNSDNDGEIAFAFQSLNESGSFIKKGDKIGQGIIMKYGVTEDDFPGGTRLGGFGSTGK